MPWRRSLLAPVFLTSACMGASPPRHSITQGTDGAFGVTLNAEGPADFCRTEALRIALAEAARRGALAPVIPESSIVVTEQRRAGRLSCMAEITVSTLPPWR